MLKILACTCGNSETLARESMHRYKYERWAMEPIYQGKEASLSVLDALINEYPDEDEFRTLYSHIDNNSKWVVFVGYDGKTAHWADISHGKMKDDTEAEVIVEKYGGNNG